MRAVDPNIDHSSPSIRGGDSLDGTVLRIEMEPPTPFMYPTVRGTVNFPGGGLLIMFETPRTPPSFLQHAAVPEDKPSSPVLANRINLPIESAGFSDAPDSRDSTCTLPTLARPARPAASSRSSASSHSASVAAASSRSSASSRVASLSLPDYERRCAERNAWIWHVSEVKRAVKENLPDIKASASATMVSARRTGRPHTPTWLGLLHAPPPPVQAFFEEAAAMLSLAVPPDTRFHVLVGMVNSNLFPDARTPAVQTPALPSRACSLP